MSGPTIFAIIYSSVTIWTAVFSRILLKRVMNYYQWLNVVIVFGGLTITAFDSIALGENVLRGSIFITLGSAMHGLTYVMSEAVMTVVDGKLTVIQNNIVQGSVAATVFLVWQLFYTVPHFDRLILHPMEEKSTPAWYAVILLISFGGANVIHSITFFHTLLHFPGGATSAGVMKGLQAVLVFACTNYLYCGRVGSREMCFSSWKLLSLISVSGGVLGYGYSTKSGDEASSVKNVGSNVGGNKEAIECFDDETTKLLAEEENIS